MALAPVRLLLALTAGLALTPSALAQLWPTTDWTLTEVVVGTEEPVPSQKWRGTGLHAALDELNAASEWFAQEGLNAPYLDLHTSGRYPARLVTADAIDEVDEDGRPVGVYGTYTISRGTPLLRLNRRELLNTAFYFNGTVQGSGAVLRNNYATLTTPVHELFHAIQASYESDDDLSTEWVAEGTANGVTLVWHQARGYPGTASKGNYDTRPLYEGDYDRDHFWYSVARDGGGVRVFHSLYDTRVRLNAIIPEIDWLDRGLRTAQLGGLRRYLQYFTATHLQEATHFDAEAGVQIGADGTETASVSGQEPLTVKAFRVSFPRPPELGRFEVRIEDMPESAQIVIGGEMFEGDVASVETTDDVCGTGSSCEIPVRVVNAAIDPASTSEISYTVAFGLAAGCAFRYPDGVSGVGYKISTPGQQPKYFAIRFPGAADGSRQQLSGPFEARYLDTATSPSPTRGVGARMEGTMTCNGGSLDISGLTRVFSGSPLEQQRQTSAESSGSWALPARPSVGQRLPDVVSEIDIAIEGDRAFTATTTTFDQQIAGRERVPLESVAERLEPRLRRGLSTWKITGQTQGRGGLHEDAIMGEMDRTMRELGVELDDATRAMIEGMMGGLLGGAEAASAGEPPQPFTLWYSLDYGVVKMVTAGTTVELFRTYSD